MITIAHALEQNNVLSRHYLYANIDDMTKHFGVIQSLADDLRCSIPEIAPLYEEVLEELSTDAQVTEYLPILVSKKVRQMRKKTNRQV